MSSVQININRINAKCTRHYLAVQSIFLRFKIIFNLMVLEKKWNQLQDKRD